MVRLADILKQDQERVQALLDKMVNMTDHCKLYISEVMEELKFSDETVKKEKIVFKQQLDSMKITQTGEEHFKQK